MALVNTSTMARCSASQSSAAAPSRLSQPAKASRALVRLGRRLGSSRCRAGTGSASQCAASVVMSSACPVRVSRSTVSWQTRSAAAGSAPSSSGPDSGAGLTAASAAAAASSAMPSAMVWPGRSTRPSLYSRTSSPAASRSAARTGGEPVPSGPVPVPLRYLAVPSVPMTSGGGCPQVAVAQRPVGRVEHRQDERGGAQRRHPGRERVGALERVLQVLLGGEQLGQHGAQLSHRGRRGHPVSHDVPDDQRDAAVGQRDRVEPVTAGGLLVPATR